MHFLKAFATVKCRNCRFPWPLLICEAHQPLQLLLSARNAELPAFVWSFLPWSSLAAPHCRAACKWPAVTSERIKSHMPVCLVNFQSSNTVISQCMEHWVVVQYLWPWLWKPKSKREKWEDVVWKKEEAKDQQWQWGNTAFVFQVIL